MHHRCYSGPARLRTKAENGHGPPLPLLLVSPSAGRVMAQNQPDTGCPANPTGSRGIHIRFQWQPVHGAKAYRLVVWRTGSDLPSIDTNTQGVSYEKTWCSYVADTDLNGWKWRVEASDPAGRLITSSETRPFRSAPCGFSPSGRPCGGIPRGVMP